MIFLSHILVITDNYNLTFDKPLSSRLQRWKLMIQQFSYTLIHRPGAENEGADKLSRLNSIREDAGLLSTLNLEEVKNLQLTSNYINKLTRENKVQNKLINNDEFKFDLKERLLIPEQLSYSILRNLHYE